jgi:hypothetical protein
MAAAPSSSASASPGAGGGPRPYRSRFGDTTLTKVFVGGLAWETPSEGLRQHFERYGDILEAVVITDRLTGRSKGYGFVSSRRAVPRRAESMATSLFLFFLFFLPVRVPEAYPQVTFREPEAALRAVQDPNPTIAGRRANCNIASLGPPRPAQPRGEQQTTPSPRTKLVIHPHDARYRLISLPPHPIPLREHHQKQPPLSPLPPAIAFSPRFRSTLRARGSRRAGGPACSRRRRAGPRGE